jgi:metal-responsive CopG/Arc/MetJ family transcriptional regulator
MRTIAVSIDEPTLRKLDRIATAQKTRRRSAVVRAALAEFISRREQAEREESERQAYAKHRDLLARQVRALVADQAKL